MNKGIETANQKVECQHCGKVTTLGNIKKHEATCYLNPAVTMLCEVCNGPIKNYKSSKGTCSRSCANKRFKSGENNGNWKGNKSDQYRDICFRHHERKCVVCGEEKIVAVHHYDHNHNNNDPANLIPICPTHHGYVHSKYASEVMHHIDAYVRKYLGVA